MRRAVRKEVVWESTGINLSLDSIALGPAANHLITSSFRVARKPLIGLHGPLHF